MIRRVKGTQDILDMRRHDAIMRAAYDHFSTAHFTHVQLPILEFHELFTHSVGQHTDIVTKEMYTFSANGKEILCLRPEGTAGSTRAYLENKITAQPWQIFSMGPMFRHERPQKGRYRQFTHLNIEAINTRGISDDVRFISLLDDLFTRVMGIKDYVLSINYLGTSTDRTAHRAALSAFVKQHQQSLCDTCKTRINTNILRIFDCKNECCQQIYTTAPRITDHLSEQSLAEWKQLQTLLHTLGISFIHNPSLVRGLDYYNNTVFEFSSPLLGAQNAFCGGGQYDLSQQLGHKQPITSIGAAIGVERLTLLLEASNDPLALPTPKPLHVIVPLSDEQLPLALLAHQALHRANLNVMLSHPRPLKKALKRANDMHAAYCVLIGAEEQEDNVVRVKTMSTGDEEKAGDARGPEKSPSGLVPSGKQPSSSSFARDITSNAHASFALFSKRNNRVIGTCASLASRSTPCTAIDTRSSYAVKHRKH